VSTKALTLADVIEGLVGNRPILLEHPDMRVEKTVIDSRDTVPGALFVALRGEHADGHDYVTDAFSRGAIAAVVERDVPSPGMILDVADHSRVLPDEWSLPVAIRVADSLNALQRIATFWRSQHTGVRVVGITGSVGKTTTKELVAAVLARRYITLKSEASYNNEIGLPLTLLHLTDKHERVVSAS
jgi:UDP-N-acetylmuramoyl-tripeptide--D-alanyl-D-alanine ligase